MLACHRAELWGRVLEEGWGWMWPSWQEGVQLLSSKAASESLKVVSGEGVRQYRVVVSVKEWHPVPPLHPTQQQGSRGYCQGGSRCTPATQRLFSY